MCLKYEVGLVEDCEQERVDKGMLVIIVSEQVICAGWVSEAMLFLCRYVVFTIILCEEQDRSL